MLPSAYYVDHLNLSPNGKEIWATSNGEGKIFVFDTATHLLKKKINMPGFGAAHGLTFVAYDEEGRGRVVADAQGDFHSDVDPRNGRPLVY